MIAATARIVKKIDIIPRHRIVSINNTYMVFIALSFMAFAGGVHLGQAGSIPVLPVLACFFAVSAVFMGSLWFFRRSISSETLALSLAAAVPSSSVVSIPIAGWLLGGEARSMAVVCHQLAISTSVAVLSAFCAALLSRGSTADLIKDTAVRTVLYPPMAFLAVGFCLGIFNCGPDSLSLRCIDFIGSTVVLSGILALILPIVWRELLRDFSKSLPAVLIRLLIAPAVVLMGLFLTHQYNTIPGQVVFLCLLPGSLVAVSAQCHRLDIAPVAARHSVTWTNICSIVTIPAWICVVRFM